MRRGLLGALVISLLVASFFVQLSSSQIDEEEFMSGISPEIRELVGIASKVPKDVDYKKEVEEWVKQNKS